MQPKRCTKNVYQILTVPTLGNAKPACLIVTKFRLEINYLSLKMQIKIR